MTPYRLYSAKYRHFYEVVQEWIISVSCTPMLVAIGSLPDFQKKNYIKFLFLVTVVAMIDSSWDYQPYFLEDHIYHLPQYW